MKVAIIGAGPAGLAAAHYLASSGDRVTVFESDSKPGGLCQSFDFAGTRIERFYHHGLAEDDYLLGFVGDMGMAGKLRWAAPECAFLTAEGLYPFSTLKDVLQFPPMSLRGRLRFCLLVHQAAGIKDWKLLENTTAEDWVATDRVGWEVWEKIWGPLMESKFGHTAERISAVWLWNKIASRKQSPFAGREMFCYMDGGFGTLWEQAVRLLERAGGRVITGCMVTRIEPLPEGGFNVCSYADFCDDFDAVLYTGSPALLPDMVRLPLTNVRALVRRPYQANICLCLHLKKSLSPYYRVYVTRSSSPYMSIIEHSNIMKGIRGYDDTIVYLSRYLSPMDPMVAASDGDITTLFTDALRKQFPTFFPEHVLDAKVFREIYAQPVISTGYQIPSFYTPERGLFVVNMSHIYPQDIGQNQAIRLGREVAKEMRQILA